MFSRSVTPMETDAHFQTLLAYPSGSPVNEPSLQFPHIELPNTDMPHSYSPPSFIFQSPRIRAPFLVPQRGPYGESCPSPEPSFTHNPGPTVYQPPPTSFPSQSYLRQRERERRSTSRAYFICTYKAFVVHTT